MNRIIRFIYRFKNQYRIHKRWASLWQIAKFSWIQSKPRKPRYNVKIVNKIEGLDDFTD